VALSLFTDFENFSKFKPAAMQEQSLGAMLDQLVPWSQAMRGVRQPAPDRTADAAKPPQQSARREPSANTT
jgi:hypothetical protein